MPRIGHTWRRVGNVLLVVLIVSAIPFYRETLAALVVSLAMALILAIQVLAIGLGYLFGGPVPATCRALSLTTAFRSNATALLLAGQVFRSQPRAAATIIAFGVSGLIVTTPTALAMARTRRTIPQPT